MIALASAPSIARPTATRRRLCHGLTRGWASPGASVFRRVDETPAAGGSGLRSALGRFVIEPNNYVSAYTSNCDCAWQTEPRCCLLPHRDWRATTNHEGLSDRRDQRLLARRPCGANNRGQRRPTKKLPLCGGCTCPMYTRCVYIPCDLTHGYRYGVSSPPSVRQSSIRRCQVSPWAWDINIRS